MSDLKPSIVDFKVGELLIQAKTKASALYIVKEGKSLVYKLDKDGKRIPIGVVGPGEYIGEVALLLNKIHSCNVEALTPVKVAKLSKELVDNQLKQIPKWIHALLIGSLDRLQHVNETLKKHGIVDDVVQSAIEAIVQGQKLATEKEAKANPAATPVPTAAKAEGEPAPAAEPAKESA
jgi:CRP-like cAMP-binding protein